MSGHNRREHLAVLAGGAAYVTGCARSNGVAKIARPHTDETVIGGHFFGDTKGKSYSGTRFASCAFRQAQFDDCTFTNCAFDDCSFEVAEFSRSTFDNCVVISGSFAHGIFLDTTMRRVTFGGVHLAHVGFDGGAIQRLTLRGCGIEHVGIKGLKLADLTIVDCGDAESLALVTSEIRGAVITDTNLREGSVYRCQLRDARFDSGLYTFFQILESTVSATTFANIRFSGANLSDSTFDAPAFTDCTFGKFFVAKNTTLRNAKLVRPVLAQDLERNTDGLVTVGGDRFPGT